MLDEEQKKALSKLSKEVLVNFVADVQGLDKLLDKKIERLLLQSDKPKLIKKLTSTLKGLKRRRKILNYWENSDFVTELHYLLDDVTSLYPEHPQECLSLLELFIDSTGSTLERVDDSNGEVGDIYRSLTLLWLQVAAHCYEQERQALAIDEQNILSQAWSEKVKALANDNDYGTKDNMLRGIDQLFSTAEIEGLIEDYKYDYEALINEVYKDKPSDTFESLHNIYSSQMNANDVTKSSLEFALTDLAWALGDVNTFEEMYLYLNTNRGFSRYHFDMLMSFMIEHKAFDVALRYLGVDEQADTKANNKLTEIERLDWLNNIYSEQSDRQAQLKVLNAAFELDPAAKRYKQIVAIATPAEQASLRKKAYELAEKPQEVLTTIDLWLEIGESELANQVAVARYEEFDEFHYSTLTGWLKPLKKSVDNTNLIQVVVYRSLLDDILESGNNMAYGHAARYYKHLIKLQAFIDRAEEGYQGLSSHEDYINQLKHNHGKKYSFWDRVEY